MAYNNNIPQPTDNISTQSQADLLENFAQLETQFSVNHTSLLAGANNGKHTFVTLLDGGDNATAANELALYSKSSGGTSKLYFRKESNGTIVEVSDITATSGAGPVTAAGTLYAIQGIDGIIHTWARLTIPNGTTTSGAITWPISYAGKNPAVVATPESSTAQTVSVGNILGASFTLSRSGTGNLTVDVIAIG